MVDFGCRFRKFSVRLYAYRCEIIQAQLEAVLAARSLDGNIGVARALNIDFSFVTPWA